MEHKPVEKLRSVAEVHEFTPEYRQMERRGQIAEN